MSIREAESIIRYGSLTMYPTFKDADKALTERINSTGSILGWKMTEHREPVAGDDGLIRVEYVVEV